jgi:hypothetical protein
VKLNIQITNLTPDQTSYWEANTGVHKSRASSMGPQYGTCFILPFWHREFWGGCYVCGKVVDPWASQGISRILQDSKAHYRVNKRPVFIPILSRISPGHSFPSWCFQIYVILSSHLCLGLPSGLCRSGFSTKTLYVFLFSPIFFACPFSFFICLPE